MSQDLFKRAIDDDLSCAQCGFNLRGQDATWNRAGYWFATCPDCQTFQAFRLTTNALLAKRIERTGDRTVAAVLASGLGIISVVLFAAGHVASSRGLPFEIYLRDTWFTLLLAALSLFTAIYFAIVALNTGRDDLTQSPIAREPR